MTDTKSRVRELEYRIETSEKPGELLLTITKQSHRGLQFNVDGSRKFTHGPVTIWSAGGPQWVHVDGDLFVRGSMVEFYDHHIPIPAADIGRVVAALEAYRAAFAK